MSDTHNYEEYANDKAADYAHRLVDGYSKSHHVPGRIVFDEKGLTYLLKRVIMEGIRMAVESKNKENSNIL